MHTALERNPLYYYTMTMSTLLHSMITMKNDLRLPYNGQKPDQDTQLY